MLREVHTAPRCVTVFQIFLKIGLEAAAGKKKKKVDLCIPQPTFASATQRDQAGPEILFLAPYALSAPNEMGQSWVSSYIGQAWLRSHWSQLNHSGNWQTKPSGCSTASSRGTQRFLPSSGAGLASES